MKKLLLVYLLAVGFVGCSKRGPDGSRIYGPEQLHARRTDVDFVLVYSIEGYRPAYHDIRKCLQGLAWGAVQEHDKTGLYEVIFMDKVSGQRLMTVHFYVVGDLFMSNKIQLVDVLY